METDPGIQPDNRVWHVDAELVQATKEAVLAIRRESEYGPRNRDRLVFRASELGHVAAYRDHNGEPGGCARIPFFSFWAERYKPRELTAEELMNFEKGNEEEETIRAYLEKAGLLVERQVRLGAWRPCGGPDPWGLLCDKPEEPRCGVGPFIHGDRRYPDRSGGLVRGKADFIINHPKHGRIPLEWKSSSTFIFGTIGKVGPKGDNGIQAHYYGFEMGTDYVALGYVNKESGDVVIFTARTDYKLIEDVLERARKLKDDIQMGRMPPMPEGVAAPKSYFDRAWPCYYYAPKKKRIGACAYYSYCHGPLPTLPRKNPIPRRPRAGGMQFNA
jgi:hypothetical protein